LVSVT